MSKMLFMRVGWKDEASSSLLRRSTRDMVSSEGLLGRGGTVFSGIGVADREKE